MIQHNYCSHPFIYWENIGMKSNIEAISDLLSEQIGCTQKERMEQYSKWNVYWNHIAKHQNINESNNITQKII